MRTQLLFIIFFLGMGAVGFSQTTISGTVTGADGVPLIGANILISGTYLGTVSGDDGSFSLSTSRSLPISLEISYTGFMTQAVTVSKNNEQLKVTLAEGVEFGEEVVVSASREEQKITDAPATITKISSLELEGNAYPDPFQTLGAAKGVEYNRKGIGTIDFNIRGFNSPLNSRNLLLVDGRLTNLVSIGVPYLQLTSVSKDDIDNVEVVLGPSSALYGFGASNGLINITTKDPRISPGTTVAVGGGNQSQRNARFRHASKIGENSGFKISGSYISAEDFEYTDSAYYSVDPSVKPTYGVAEYGLNNDIKIYKGEAAFYTEVAPSTDLILSTGYGNGHMVQTSSIGRNQFDGWANFYGQAKISSPRWFAQFFYNGNKTSNDNSRLLPVLTDNVESYRQFAAFSKHPQITEEYIAENAHTKRLLNIMPDGTLLELPLDSRYKDDSNRMNGEVQYNNRWGAFRFVGGLQYNREANNSLGTFLIEPNGGDDIVYTTMGFYSQMEYRLGTSLKFIGALRGDNHSQWGFHLAPKAAIVKTTNIGAFRLTYGKGIVAPTALNAEIIFAGGRLLGNSEGFTLLDVDLATGQTSETKIDPLTVEKVQTFEAGYKGKISDKVFLDVNAYYNIHTDYIPAILQEMAFINAETGKARVVLKRGEQDISDIQVPLFNAENQLANTPLFGLVESGVIPADASLTTQTFWNFADLQTFGADFGIRIQFDEKWSGLLNYSYLDYAWDENDLSLDLNGNGVVEEYLDIAVNSPKHRFNTGVNYMGEKFFGGLAARMTSQYNFIAGQTVASETLDLITPSGYQVVEGQDVEGTYNPGPLGGVLNFDFNLGYRITDNYTVAGSVTNLFDSQVRDFVTSPVIGRLVNLELKATF